MKKALVLTYWSYRSGLIQAYTMPYVRMIEGRLKPGGKVLLVTMEQEALSMDPARQEEESRRLARSGITWIPLPYRRFGPGAVLQMAWRVLQLAFLCLRERVDVIHAFCMPAGGLGCLLSYVTGIPLILDSYEPHAEGMVAYGEWKESGAAYRILFALEGLQSRRATTAIAAAPAMRDYARRKYGVEFERFHVKPACVDLERFSRRGIDVEALREAHGLGGKVVCVYAGKTGGTYLGREIFDFFKVASARWKGRFRALVLTSDPPSTIAGFCRESGFDDSELLCRFVDHEDIPKFLAMADFALTPVKPLPIKLYCAPIKNGEYWAMGLPVVITPGIAGDSRMVAEHRLGAVLDGLDRAAYERALGVVDDLLVSEDRPLLAERIRKAAEATRSLAVAEAVYSSVYGPRREA